MKNVIFCLIIISIIVVLGIVFVSKEKFGASSVHTIGGDLVVQGNSYFLGNVTTTNSVISNTVTTTQMSVLNNLAIGINAGNTSLFGYTPTELIYTSTTSIVPQLYIDQNNPTGFAGVELVQGTNDSAAIGVTGSNVGFGFPTSTLLFSNSGPPGSNNGVVFVLDNIHNNPTIDRSGNFVTTGYVSSSHVISGGDSAGKMTCWKADGQTIGFCSGGVVTSTGACTCN